MSDVEVIEWAREHFSLGVLGMREENPTFEDRPDIWQAALSEHRASGELLEYLDGLMDSLHLAGLKYHHEQVEALLREAKEGA